MDYAYSFYPLLCEKIKCKNCKVLARIIANATSVNLKCDCDVLNMYVDYEDLIKKSVDFRPYVVIPIIFVYQLNEKINSQSLLVYGIDDKYRVPITIKNKPKDVFAQQSLEIMEINLKQNYEAQFGKDIMFLMLGKKKECEMLFESMRIIDRYFVVQIDNDLQGKLKEDFQIAQMLVDRELDG